MEGNMPQITKFLAARLTSARTGLAAALIALTAASGSAIYAQQTIFYVVVNYHSTPPTVGVAPANWSSPNWLKSGGPHYSSSSAWGVACKMHTSNRFFSPDIANGLVSC